MSLIVTDSAEQLEGRLEVIANFANRSQITTSVAVVRRTPHSYDVLVGKVIFIALVHQLMSASNQ